MNLIVTCPRHFEEDAASEILSLFERFGYDAPEIIITKMPGILMVHTIADPLIFVKQIADLVPDEPWAIRYSQRIIPIQKSTLSQIPEIINSVSQLYSVMGKDQTYRITIEKRHSELSSTQIITEIAKIIPNKVSLDNFDWIVLVQILANRAGVSILCPDQIVSIEKIKRSLSD